MAGKVSIRWSAALKMNSAQMKPTEQQILWKLVKAGEQRPLSAADLAMTFY
jgi:hypothetical protein